MAYDKDQAAAQRRWYVIIILIAAAVIVLLTLFTNVFEGGDARTTALLLGAAIVIVALLIMASTLVKITQLLGQSGARLERVCEAQDKIRAVLTQIQQSARLSEVAKGIAYREADARAIREAIFDKLQQQDFEGAHKIIEELSETAAYGELAIQLHSEVEKFQTATDQGRENQLISNIDELLDEYQWAKASAQIERLIRAFPDSDRVKQMRQKLADRKEERKKALLGLWDGAVKRQETDRSLEILRELDMYLTPNEALALQEAARDVFRTKLHNLGVQFALAVSGKQWAEALQTGEQIMRDFPNSRMAQEIRDRIDILRQRVEQQRR